MKLETLETWLQIWKELLEDPQELLLGKSFINASRAVTDQPKLGQHVGRNNLTWKCRLLRILEQQFDSETVTIDYLRAEHRSDVVALDSLLHDPQSYDVGKIVPHLNNIRNAPSLALLRKELQQELLRNPLDKKRLIALLRLQLRYYVTKLSAQTIAELPKSVLTRRAATLFVGKHVRALTNHEVLNAQTRALLRELLLVKSTAKRAARLTNKKSTSVFNIFRCGLWWNLSYRLVEDVSKPLCSLLVRIGKDEPTAPQVLLLADKTVLTELGARVVEDYVQGFLRTILSKVGRAEVIKKRSNIKKLGMQLGDYLLATAHFEHDRFHGWRPNTVDHLSIEALDQAAAKTVSVTAAKRIISEEDLPLATAVGRLVIQTFADVAAGKVDWKSVTHVELETVCAEALARKNFHEELGALLIGLNGPILERVRSLASEGEEDSINDALPNAAQFWHEWIESLAIATGTYKTVYGLLPWSALTEAEFSCLLDNVLDSLVQPKENWLVGFKIFDIEPQAALWTMGNITLYDPTVYDFGEGRWLFKHTTEAKKAVTFAKVAVTADTPAEAVSKARRNLEDSLNVLSFERSAGVNVGGLNPKVDRNSYVVNVSTRIWTGGWTLSPFEMPTEHGAVQSELTSIASKYDRVLSKAASQPENVTQLQAGFRCALYWYRKGRWEPDPTERFSFYWIALEHLTTKDKVEDMFDGLSELHITWRDVSGVGIMWRNLPTLGQLEWWRDEAVERIKGDSALRASVESSLDLRGWGSDPNLLLRPEKFDVLVPLVPAGSEHERFFTEYRDDIKEIAGNKAMITQRAESMRSKIWFRLRLLYRVRNQLFHEALTFRPDIEVHAAALEHILEDTLTKMVNEVVTASPKCETMDELVAWYQQPWM
jgi:hypothetical protein